MIASDVLLLKSLSLSLLDLFTSIANMSSFMGSVMFPYLGACQAWVSFSPLLSVPSHMHGTGDFFPFEVDFC